MPQRTAYDVFTPESNARLIGTILRLGRFERGARVADLGCGSGVFTDLLRQRGYNSIGLDLSPKLIELGRSKFPGIEFIEGDVEHLPFPAQSLDGILLSGIVHHLPDPARCASEAFRVLRPGGRFVAFDPESHEPVHVALSRPFVAVLQPGRRDAERTAGACEKVASRVPQGRIHGGHGVSHPDLRYRYIASSRVRWLLPLYNAIDGLCLHRASWVRFAPSC